MTRRAKILAKLGLLLGGPVLLLGGLFSAGIWVGTTHARSVSTFERDVLGLPVEVPPEPGAAPATPAPAAPATPAPSAPSVTPAGSPPVAAPPVAPVRAPVPAAAVPVPAGLPVAVPERLDDEALAERLAALRTIRVKVLVDRERTRDPSWIADAHRLVEAVSASYEVALGIELTVVGIVSWDVATAALDPERLRADLASRPREGAEIVIGLADRAFDEPATSIAEGDALGGVVLVGAEPGATPHHRALLRELGHALGSADVVDAQSAAYQRGSWMSLAPVPPGATPWIDPESRRRILARKSLPVAAAEVPG
jgi:hypothetical protein